VSSPSRYPVATGNAAILSTIIPNSRPVRWLSANSNLIGNGGDSIALDNVLTVGEWEALG
jgi:hypothetical protein